MKNTQSKHPARIATNISRQLDTEMRIYIARRKLFQRDYNIRKFLECAIADKIAKEDSNA